MPLLKLETSVPLSGDKQKSLLALLGKTVASTLGKPEQYVMVTCGPSAIWMSGSDTSAAFVDLRSIGGLTDAVNRKLSAQVCRILTEALDLSPERIYLNFSDVEPGRWGWNGGTFG